MDKKAKAEAKRARRLKRKQDDDAENLSAAQDGQPKPLDDGLNTPDTAN